MTDEDREALVVALDTLRNATQAQVIDALQPAVDAIARRRAAEELRAAADDLHSLMPELDWADWLRARAEALTHHEETL